MVSLFSSLVFGALKQVCHQVYGNVNILEIIESLIVSP